MFKNIFNIFKKSNPQDGKILIGPPEAIFFKFEGEMLKYIKEGATVFIDEETLREFQCPVNCIGCTANPCCYDVDFKDGMLCLCLFSKENLGVPVAQKLGFATKEELEKALYNAEQLVTASIPKAPVTWIEDYDLRTFMDPLTEAEVTPVTPEPEEPQTTPAVVPFSQSNKQSYVNQYTKRNVGKPKTPQRIYEYPVLRGTQNPPLLREVAVHLGFSHRNSLGKYLPVLKNAGLVDWTPGIARSYKPIPITNQTLPEDWIPTEYHVD